MTKIKKKRIFRININDLILFKILYKKMKKIKSIYLTILLLFILLIISCHPEREYDRYSLLKFSSDSVFIDTSFATVTTITRIIKVYNTSSKPILIDKVYLSNGSNSMFRFNIDGEPGPIVIDLEIDAKDSLFLFINATIDPNDANTPFIIEDSIIFIVNGKNQKIKLAALGQNAYFHTPDHPPTQYLPAYSLVSGVWENDKPHVIYGIAVVDEDCTLVIPAGTKVYMHRNAMLWVYKGGSLKIKGNPFEPVLITSDRLDPFYRDQAGGWDRIWLSALSKDNEIDWAIIQNGNVGIHADTVANANPTLKINNTIIRNMSTACLFAQGAKIVATNCLFANAKYYSALLSIGGYYVFKHCNFVNFWNTSHRSSSLLALNNYYKDINGNIQIRPISVYMGNCIVYGDQEEEILIDKHPGIDNFFLTLDHCLLRTKYNLGDSIFINCIRNKDPEFRNHSIGDFRLQNNSPCIDAGKINISWGINNDLSGGPRIANGVPDIGAYELY